MHLCFVKKRKALPVCKLKYLDSGIYIHSSEASEETKKMTMCEPQVYQEMMHI